MKKSKKLYFKLFLSIFILLLFTKIDFRFYEYPPGLIVDDAEYYYHVQTIVKDMDLDYSNQMEGADYRNLNKLNNNPVPVHPIGSGIFAAPIIFITNFISNIFNIDSIVSFNYFIYSLVPILYLYLSVLMLYKIISYKNININFLHLLLISLGSGVSYFAFERFSMSHAYEFFGQALILYFLFKMETSSSRKNIYLFLIPVFIFLVFSIRWSNYHVFLTPLIYCFVFNKKLIGEFKSLFFFSGFLFGASIYYYISYKLYGVLTLNPSDLFLQVENRLTYNYERFFDITLFFDNLLLIGKSLLVILFSHEFGLLYFSPIIFIGFIMSLIFLYQKKFSNCFLIFLISFIPFMGVVVLQNTGYSYGFRYLFSLAPIYIIFYSKFFYRNKIIYNYLFFVSIFSIISQLFFEASPNSILYSEYVINSFGQETKFVNPDYLTSLLSSFLIIDSYLNVIFTSFIGIFILKILALFTSPIEFITRFREPNEDILRLIDNADAISLTYLLFLILLFYGLSRDFIRKLN